MADDTRNKPGPRPRALLESLLGTPAAVVLALVLFGLVNYLGARHYRRFDWTRHKLFSLSPRSREIARSLREPTDVYVLLGRGESMFSEVSELAERYAAETPKVRVHTIDPDRQSDRLVALSRQLGFRVVHMDNDSVASEAAIVVARGDRHWEVPREALQGLGAESAGDEGAAGRMAQAQVTVERSLSEALLHVDRNETTRMCVASGHGELPLQGGEESLSSLVSELSHDNVQAREVPVRGSVEVPSDCDVLVVAGPRQAFTPGDADILTRYLHAGGNVLLLLDPIFVDRQFAPSGLEPVARLGGIELTQTIVIEPDPDHQIPGMLPATFTAGEFGEHPVTRAFRGSQGRVLVTSARALRRDAHSSVVPESLLRTTGAAWGETGTTDAIRDGQLARDGSDLPGPLDLAMAAQVPDVHRRAGARPDDAAGRLVVVGYSHLATNESLSLGQQARFVSADLVIASLGWLSSRTELVEIPGHPATNASLTVTSQDLKYLRIYCLLLVPLAAALVGLAVWRARKAT